MKYTQFRECIYLAANYPPINRAWRFKFIKCSGKFECIKKWPEVHFCSLLALVIKQSFGSLTLIWWVHILETITFLCFSSNLTFFFVLSRETEISNEQRKLFWKEVFYSWATKVHKKCVRINSLGSNGKFSIVNISGTLCIYSCKILSL